MVAMHEMSLALSLLDTIKKSLEGKNVKKLREITIEVGSLAMVNTEQLSFCFSIVAKGEIFSDMKLDIQKKEAVFRCISCLREVSSEELLSNCSFCGSSMEFISGDELILKRIKAEVEDA